MALRYDAGEVVTAMVTLQVTGVKPFLSLELQEKVRL